MNATRLSAGRRVLPGIITTLVAIGAAMLAPVCHAQTPNDFVYGALSSLPTNFDRVYAFRRASSQSDVLASSATGTGTTVREIRSVFVDGQYIYLSDFIRGIIFRIDRTTGNRDDFITGAVRADVLRPFRARGQKGFVFSLIDTNNSTRLILYREGVGLTSCGSYPDVGDVASDLNGKIYIACQQVNTIYTFDPYATTGAFGSLTTSGVAINAPGGLAFYDSQTLLVTNILNYSLDAINLGVGSTATVSRVSGAGRGSGAPFQTLYDVKVDGQGRVFVFASTVGLTNDQFIEVNMTTGDRATVGTTNGRAATHFSIYDGISSDSQLVITQTGPGEYNLQARVPPRHPFRILASTDLASDTFADITGYRVGPRDTNSFPVSTALAKGFFRLEVLP